jgi:NAD dependent epimerase/dehydratase family enzyme
MKYSGIINLSGPNIVSIRELAENIGDLLNKIVLYEILGISSKDLLGDNTFLFSLLPDFRLTNIREGLSKTFLMKSN